MFSKTALCAGLCLCITLPTWAETESAAEEALLPVSAAAVPAHAPALQAFMQRVWAESPAVQGARAALDAARARAAGADRPLHNPVLELDAEQTGVNTASLGLSQTIDWSDKRGAMVQIADQQVQAAEARLREIRQRTAAETLGALADLSTAREMRALAQRSSQLMKAFFDTVQKRQAAGDIAALDVTLAQVAYSEALMEQAASESRLAEAEAALQAVTGLTAQSWPQLPENLVPVPQSADPALLDTLPDLAVLRSRMEAAKGRIALARKQGKIDPTIGIRAGREESDELLGVSIGIPLFVRNNYREEVRAAAHDAAAAEQAWRDAHRRAAARLNAALGRFNSTSHAWQVWSAGGRQAQREQMELLEQMWQAGELTATDFLIQAKQNIDTQATATMLLNEVWQSAIAWLAASGQIEPWLDSSPAQTRNSGE